MHRSPRRHDPNSFAYKQGVKNHMPISVKRDSTSLFLEKLVQRASSLDSKDIDGFDCPGLYCRLGDAGRRWEWRLAALELLVHNGADLFSKDQMGNTTLDHLLERWVQAFLAPANEADERNGISKASVAIVIKALKCINDTEQLSHTSSRKSHKHAPRCQRQISSSKVASTVHH